MKLFLIFIGVFVAYSALAFELPVDSSKYIPGSYGGRDFLAAGGDHLGEDVALIEGTSIKAIGDGKIVFYGSASGYGELVCVIEHDLGDEYAFINGKGEVVITRYILSIYGHLRKKKNRDDAGGLQWIVEDDVLEGDVIGYVNDDLHNGDGAEHLHLGIRLSDKQTAMNNDPGKWFRGYNKGTNQYLDFAAASQVIKILQNGGIQNLCKKYNDNSNVICWQPISKNDVGCNNASERRLYRNTTGEIIIVDNSFCPANDLVNVAYSAHDAGYGIGGGGTGSSTGGAWCSGGPYPDDPIYDNDPFVPNADVSIRYLRIKGPGQSNHHTESGAVFYPGQTQSVDLKGKIKNESNDNTDMARIQYCATTKKKFRHDERIWIDEDYLNHQEREHDFDPGESITKHGQVFV